VSKLPATAEELPEVPVAPLGGTMAWEATPAVAAAAAAPAAAAAAKRLVSLGTLGVGPDRVDCRGGASGSTACHVSLYGCKGKGRHQGRESQHTS
jgi:hypothetical protein